MVFMSPQPLIVQPSTTDRGSEAVEELADAIMAGQPAGGIAGTPPTRPDIRTHLPKWLRHAELAATQFAPGDVWFVGAVKATILARTAELDARQQILDRAARNRLLAAALGADGPNPKNVRALLALGDGVRRAWRDTTPRVRKAIRARLDINARVQEPVPSPAALTRYWLVGRWRNDEPGRFLRLNLAAADFNDFPAVWRLDLLAAQNALAVGAGC